MSSHDGPDEFATRRVPRPDAPPPGDPTGRVGDDLPPDATQRIDPAVNERTRAAGAARREPLSYEQPWPADQPATGGAHYDDRPDPGVEAAAAEEAERLAEQERKERRRRDLLLGLVGALVGFALAFVVVALSTDDGTGEVTAADERVSVMESDLAERDARIQELEAQLAEAEAAGGERDADIAAQQEALDERSAALDERNEQLNQRGEQLDERERALNDREQQLDQREQQLDQREQQLEQRENESGEPPAEGEAPAEGGETGGDGGIDLPDLPDAPSGEDVDNFVEDVLDRIRNLFGG